MKRDYGLIWLVMMLCLLLLIPILLLVNAPPAHGQCGLGGCPTNGGGGQQWGQPQYQPPQFSQRPSPNRSASGLRYATPIGHLAAVVRVRCLERNGHWSVGSGVVILYDKRYLILTANHVTRATVQQTVRVSTGKWHDANLLTSDETWDCSVLEISKPEGVTPAEVAWGEEAHPARGAPLQSCGFGSNDRLAVNTGRFLGYKRSTQARIGVDDWMELSGPARGGDSGGPIFNAAGKVVGVLWGSTYDRRRVRSSDIVIGAQCGRIHLALQAAVGRKVPRKTRVIETASAAYYATPCGTRVTRPLIPVAWTGGRNPTLAPPRPDQTKLFPNLCPPRPTPPAIPTPPNVIVQNDPAVAAALQSIDGKLSVVISNTTPPGEEAADKADTDGPKPLIIVFCILAAVMVAGFIFYVVGGN